MTYSVTASGQILRSSDGTQIPVDSGNMDYVAYLAWLAAGNVATILPVSPLTVEQQIAKVSAACQASILAGFPSNALGATYWYPSDWKDQLNLDSSVLHSTLPSAVANPNWKTPFKVATNDANGTWSYLQHTAAQIQQAGEDGKAYIIAAILRCDLLEQQILNADSDAAIAAINW